MNNKQLLDVKGLKKYFPIRKGIFKRVVGYVKAVNDIDFQLADKETLGVVGESGCGKTTLLRSVVRAIEPTAGQIFFRHEGEEMVDIAALDEATLNKVRRNIQMIFQDPHSSLNPRIPVWEVIGEPLLVNNIAKGKKLRSRVRELLTQVGLDESYMQRYPHAFSGGQRQRIGIARALSINPSLILADEPTSALDVSVQAQILNLLVKLQQRYDLSYLFITHDLGVIKHISDRVAVMYVGNIVETGSTADIFNKPAHPYTEALLSAMPEPDPDIKMDRILLEGDVADPSRLPSGCPFHPRCKYAGDICQEQKPQLKPKEDDSSHEVACYFAEELELNTEPATGG